MWPILNFLLPSTWQRIHSAVQELLSKQPQLLLGVLKRIHVGSVMKY